MSTLTLATSIQTLNILDAPFMLEREGSIDSILPTPVWDEEYASSPDTEGGRRIRSRPDNPTGGGRMKITGTTASDLRENIRTWQENVEAARRSGAVLTYTPTSGTAVSYDVVSMQITSMTQDQVLLNNLIQETDFEFTCLPFGRLAATTILSGTASGPIDSFTVPDPGGSAPALGELRFVDTASQNRGDIQFAFDEHWDAGLGYPISIAAGSLTTTGFDGSATTRTGAWTTTAVVRVTLAMSSKTICSATSNHLGRHRVKARVYGVGTGDIYMRLKWRIGDTSFVLNDWKTLPGTDDYYELDLGLINIPEVEVGSQGWEGWIEAYSQTTGDTVDVAALEFLPADRFGRAKGQIEVNTTVIGTTTSAHDEFDQAAGNLTAKTLPQGGTWTFGGTSTPTDFTMDTTGHTAQRTAVSSATARLVYASTPSLADLVLRGDLKFSARASAAVRYGFVMRWVDSSNFAIVYQDPSAVIIDDATATPTLNFAKVTGGTLKVLKSVSGNQYGTVNTWYSFEVQIDVAGNFSVAWGAQGSSLNPLLVGQDSALATGGTLASGKAGLYDLHPGATAVTRNYDNFALLTDSGSVTTITSRVVMNSGKSLRVTSDRTRKEPTSGSVWSRVPFEGHYVQIIPGQTSRLVMKARRSNVDLAPDLGISDAMTFSLIATPRVALLG